MPSRSSISAVALFALTLAPIPIALHAATGSAPDRDAATARERSLETRPTAAAKAGAAAPRVLFTHQGDDNACALLVRPDADDDGVPDVVIGWEIFKSDDNLEVLDGAGYADGQLVWSLETADGISGGYFSDVDQLSAFPDVTGDGVDELLTGTSGGGRSATLYDGASGVVLQSFDTYLGADSGWVYDVQAMGDVNGNGTPDFALAAGSDADSVFMVDGGSRGVHHDEIWQYEAADVFYTLAVVGDIDGDGVDDLVGGTGDNLDDLFALSGASGGELWRTALDGSIYDVAAYADVDGDGVSEIVAGVWSSSRGVVLLDGESGAVSWESGAVSNFVMKVVPFDDVDGDGWPEIAVASWANSAFVLDGQSGGVAWEQPAGGDVWAINRVDDVTGDGVSEIAYGSFAGSAHLADGATGETLWSHSADGRKVLALTAGDDVDGDGAPEVLIGAQQLDAGSATLAWLVSADSGLATAGPELELIGDPALGETVTAEVTGATPGSVVAWLRGSRPTLIPVPIIGWLAVAPPALVATRVVDESGAAAVDFDVPNDPALIGRELYLQAIEVDAGSGRSANRIGFSVTDVP